MQLASPDEFWRIGPPGRLWSRGKEGPLDPVSRGIRWCTIAPETIGKGRKRHGFKIVANFRIFSICQGQWQKLQFSCSFPLSIYCFIGCHVTNFLQFANLANTWGTLARPKVPSPRSFCTWYLAYLQAVDIYSISNTRRLWIGKDWTPEFRPHGYAEFRQTFFLWDFLIQTAQCWQLRAGANSMDVPQFFQWRTPSCHPASGPGNDPKTPLGTAKDPIYKSKWWCISAITSIHTTTINWWNAQHHSSEAWNWMQSKHA